MNASLGLPKRVKSAVVFQQGWGKTATEYPRDCSSRPIRLTPKDGWSTYASPVTSTKSTWLAPFSSSTVVGKNVIGISPKRCEYFALPMLKVTMKTADAKEDGALLSSAVMMYNVQQGGGAHANTSIRYDG